MTSTEPSAIKVRPAGARLQSIFNHPGYKANSYASLSYLGLVVSHDTATWGVDLSYSFVAVLRRIIVQMIGKFVGLPHQLQSLRK